MESLIEPIQVQSLKEACVNKLQELILSGKLKIGQALPPERRLAEQLGVSRPVLHEALVDLASKGLVTIVPRRGVFVSDFRTSGSLAMLTALISYHNGELDQPFLESLLQMRLLMEVETARLAAIHRTPAHLEQFQVLLEQERQVNRQDVQALAEIDFRFHQLVAIASGNLVYPLVINSFKPVYTNLTSRFFKHYLGKKIIEEVFDFHRQLVQAIQNLNPHISAMIMTEMLNHGARHLLSLSGGKNGNPDLRNTESKIFDQDPL
ncbi:MAG: Transcriptional regulator, GntR family [Anaerolineae bacterium]|nr:MAG: Transcriptional regulator, GntR family [Anaerolineae bacterium]